MDISRNTVTGEIAKAINLSGNYRTGDWVDCINRTTGNIKKSEQPYVDAWELQQVKTAKINSPSPIFFPPCLPETLTKLSKSEE